MEASASRDVPKHARQRARVDHAMQPNDQTISHHNLDHSRRARRRLHNLHARMGTLHPRKNGLLEDRRQIRAARRWIDAQSAPKKARE
jgi:hypothetical protein